MVKAGEAQRLEERVKKKGMQRNGGGQNIPYQPPLSPIGVLQFLRCFPKRRGGGSGPLAWRTAFGGNEREWQKRKGDVLGKRVRGWLKW